MTKLEEICCAFIKEQMIRSADSIYQCDWISEHSLELIEEICAVLGYWDDDKQEVMPPNSPKDGAQ